MDCVKKSGARPRTPRVSVCMAVYNGGSFLTEQIDSILPQLNRFDELIIVNDGSTDMSARVIKGFDDTRIRVLTNPNNSGIVRSFETAIKAAQGDYIFLCDQDDIWLPNKISSCLDHFAHQSPLLIVTDAAVVDEHLGIIHPSYFVFRKSRPGFWNNMYKNSFLGCCMAFSASCKEFILPFPRRINMHDEWIGLCCSLAGRVLFAPEPGILYRRHETNATGMRSGGFTFMIRKRFMHLVAITRRLNRIRRFKRQSAHNSLS